MNEKRHSHRIHFDCLVEFESGDFRHVCELLDISLQGALICGCSGATPSAGTPCRLILTLDEKGEVQIIMEGRVAHKIENRVGIHCESIDMDSMTHLRNLVESNLGDHSLLERDLKSLVH